MTSPQLYNASVMFIPGVRHYAPFSSLRVYLKWDDTCESVASLLLCSLNGRINYCDLRVNFRLVAREFSISDLRGISRPNELYVVWFIRKVTCIWAKVCKINGDTRYIPVY